MNNEANKRNDQIDFPLFLGGPLYRLLLLTGLARTPLLLQRRRMLVVALLTWFPLLILSMVDGAAFSGVNVPFIFDIDAHVRFLACLMLLIYAEVFANERVQIIARHFVKNHIVSQRDQHHFYEIIRSAMRLTNSTVAEVILIVMTFTLGRWISTENLPLNASVWYLSTIDNTGLSLSGYWYLWVSVPLFQFILFRWYYRMLIWYFFLWRVSRLPLQLNSLHPDRAGGLGFLTTSVFAFAPLLLAHSVLLSGMIFNRIWHAGATVMDYQALMICMIIFTIALPIVPLFFFMKMLARTRRGGTREYDLVATRYVNEFRKKWINHPEENRAGLLGTSDIQSLADLANSFSVSANMRMVPVARGSIISVIVLTILPFLPLMITIMPMEQIIRQAIGIIF